MPLNGALPTTGTINLSVNRKIRQQGDLAQLIWPCAEIVANLSTHYALAARVHNGQIHIESNDILTYLEGVFPNPELIPNANRSEIPQLLHHEDELHMALRTVSFRFFSGSKSRPSRLRTWSAMPSSVQAPSAG